MATLINSSVCWFTFVVIPYCDLFRYSTILFYLSSLLFEVAVSRVENTNGRVI